jgi:NAD-reducing hydrogenase small subunit
LRRYRNVTALRNLFSIEDVLDRSYRENSTVVVGIPRGDDIVPKLLPRVRSGSRDREGGSFLPGCPPSADTIHTFLMDLLDGREPSTAGLRFG